MEKVRVLVYSAYFPPAYLGGGALKSVAAIVSQAPDEFEVTVVTSDRDLGQREAMPVVTNTPQRWNNATVYYGSSGLIFRLRALTFWRSRNPVIVYTNSFFDPVFSILPLIMWRIGLLQSQYFVVAPRGEFGPGALNIKPTKKKLALPVLRLLLSSRRVVWHASSVHEAANIRNRIGKSAQVIISEDNTTLPLTASAPNQPGPELRAVVIGRIVPVKGIRELLEALADVSQPLVVDIYGPEEDRPYAQQCRSLAAQLPEQVVVNFKGAIPSQAVTSTLCTYDLMLLPTRGENFSHVVAEALSVSLPVMCADVTPWSKYIADGGGVLLSDSEVPTWTASIEKYAGMSAVSRKAKRNAAGKQYEIWRASAADKTHVFDLILRPNS